METLESPICSEANQAGREFAARLQRLESQVAGQARTQQRIRNGLTIIAFSGDMDKLGAGFTLATGAAAMCFTVSMFFTFWGLSALKRTTRFKGKGLLGKLLTAMQPSGPGTLGLSKWNLLGLGRSFFDMVMRRRHVQTLTELIGLARELKARMVACQASMEVMAITREEILEGVEIGGVATCLDAVCSSGATLFV